MPSGYRRDKPPAKSYTQALNRVGHLRATNEPYMEDRARIRALNNGGRAALNVLLKDLPTNDSTVPAANMVASGIERFSEMISPAPDLRIDPPSHKDSDKARKDAEKRERILTSHDEKCNLVDQLIQMSLWMPGYAFGSWKITERKDRNGYKYPRAEIRDPYTTWPAEWGVDQKPADVAYQRFVDPQTLASIYPHAKSRMEARRRLEGGAVDLSSYAATNSNGKPGWDGHAGGGVEVIEYVDAWGTYVLCPEMGDFLDVFEHPLNVAPFVVPRRFSFDQLRGQFTDAIGLAISMAKLTLLTQIVMEDAAFAPVVVNGRMDKPFRKGRDAVNVIEGGGAQYLYQNFPYQMFAEIDRLDGHFRGMTGYSKQADGESPISFVTGQGLEELGSTLNRQVERYQHIMSSALVELDSMRLEWDEVAYGGEKRPLEGYRKGAAFAEEYDPAEIAGNYRTRRVYGLMAGWDDARKIVGGLQLLSAGAIDITTLRENLRGLENIPQIEERAHKDKALGVLYDGLLAAAQQGDPNAIRVAAKVYKTGDLDAAIEEFYAPQEEAAPEPVAQEPMGPMEFMAAQAGGESLSRLTQDGNATGGTQIRGQF